MNREIAASRAEKEWIRPGYVESEDEEQERLRLLADICRRTSQPFWAGYLDGRIIAFNRSCCQLLGFGEEELRSQDRSMNLMPLLAQKTEAEADEYLPLTRQPQLYGREYIRQDGSKVVVEMLVHPVCDFEGHIQYYYAFLTDISNECQMVKYKEAGSRRWPPDLITQQVVIYACQPQADYSLTFVSQKVKTLFGFEPEEFLDDPKFWINHLHPQDAPRVFEVMSHLMEQEYHTLGYRFQNRDGTYRLVHNVLGLMRDSDGRPKEIVGWWIEMAQADQRKETWCGKTNDFRCQGEVRFRANQGIREGALSSSV